jgi:8-oxo-dGTP pyrophosphatase MutT (NUDIX family)
MKKEQRMLGDDKNWEHVFITQRLVLTDITTKKFLLVKYAVGLSLEADSNPWGFVGGHLEEKEELLDSLYREAAEEAGNIEYDVI